MLEYIIEKGEQIDFHLDMDAYFIDSYSNLDIKLREQSLCFEYDITNHELAINKVMYTNELKKG